MLKTKCFTAATADIYRIGFIHLLSIGEYSHYSHRYLSTRP